MHPVFNNPFSEAQFNQRGFLTLKLMTPHELNSLKKLLSSLDENASENKSVESSYSLSFFDSSADYKKLVFNEIYNFFKTKIDRLFSNYEPLIVNVFDKKPGMGEVPVHQNWTFVDEEKFTSISLWIPLVDVSRHNGTLEVVSGTQKQALSLYRSPSIPWVFEDLREPLKQKYLQPLEIKAGEVAVLDDSLLHWSSENKSAEVRTAVQLILVPKKAQAIHYYKPKPSDSKVEVYAVNSNFFTSFNMNEAPQNVPKIGELEFTPEKLSEAEFINRICQPKTADLWD